MDIKPDNILISFDINNHPQFYLTDFGKAKIMEDIIKSRKQEDVRYDTPGGSIYKYVHPMIRPHLRPDQISVTYFEDHGPMFDLYSLGKVFEDVYKRVPEYNSVKSDKPIWYYLINDLCHNEEEKSELGLKLKDFGNNTNDVYTTVLRIKSPKNISLIYESDTNEIPLIRLADREACPFPVNIQKYIDTPEFQRLRSIKQLGETELVYPGAAHSRFLHSIGTYYRCISYVNSLQKHPLFNYLYNDDDVSCLLLAALLHDVGHYPYAHYFEEIKGFNEFIGFKIKHENLSIKIVRGDLSIKKCLENQLLCKTCLHKIKPAISKVILDQPSLAELLEGENKKDKILNIWEGKGKFRLFKDILSGPIDCDKLDYLIRDSKETGVPYGKMVDLERFFFSLTLDTENLPNIRLAVTAKGKAAVESIISSRYNLFSEVYWHKTCRAATAMIKEGLWHARNHIQESEYEWAAIMLTDDEFLLWLSDKIGNDEIACDLLGGLKLGYTRKIYKRIRTFSFDWKEEEKKLIYIKFIDLIGNNFVAIHRYTEWFIQKLNSIGSTQKDWKEVKAHHIIIDVPNVGQDILSSLKIKYPAFIKGKMFYNLNDISKLSDSIYNSFRVSTKKVRIFCIPEIHHQLNSLGINLDNYIKDCFDEIDG